MKTVVEAQRNLPVYDEADVLIVGGGPAGHSAAVAAARAGAEKIVVVERYGHLGGMATGGIVILIPHLSVGNCATILGLQEEWLERLAKIPGGLVGPRLDQTGSADPELIDKWRPYFAMVWDNVICHGAYVDPDLLKIVLDQMLEEEKARITTYLHSWGTAAIMEGGAVKGVIFESKEGRKAILARVVIDCTGDGDIFASAGAPFDEDRDVAMRNSMTAVVYRVGGCDFGAFGRYKLQNPEEWNQKHMPSLAGITGFRMSPHPTPKNDVVWVNNWLPNRYCLNVKDLTDTEFTVRRTMLQAIDYLKRNVPGFKGAYLYDIAPQLGTRGSRRLRGEYKLTVEDLKNTFQHEDVISVAPAINLAISRSPTEIPYRVMVPQDVENLLVAGRCFSSDIEANNFTNLIPHCVAMGQAAGVAAACSLQSGASVRAVDVKKMQAELKRQGAFLPR